MQNEAYLGKPGYASFASTCGNVVLQTLNLNSWPRTAGQLAISQFKL